MVYIKQRTVEMFENTKERIFKQRLPLMRPFGTKVLMDNEDHYGVVRLFVRLLRNVNFISETQFSGGVFVFSLAITACLNRCRQYVTLCVYVNWDKPYGVRVSTP